MSTVVDCRGLACPEPVLLTRQALQNASGNEIKVLVSSAVARDNVTRAAASLGWKLRTAEHEDGFQLTLTK